MALCKKCRKMKHLRGGLDVERVCLFCRNELEDFSNEICNRCSNFENLCERCSVRPITTRGMKLYVIMYTDKRRRKFILKRWLPDRDRAGQIYRKVREESSALYDWRLIEFSEPDEVEVVFISEV